MFSNAYRLEVKKQKSEVYNAGMSYYDIRRVTYVSGLVGFYIGRLPFKYLGVSISKTKTKNRDCQVMIDKMVNRIHAWS